jgi:hypothetical protein
MNKKCFNCELKDGVIVYYKDIYFCSKECEEIIWSNKEKNEFNKKLDKLVNIYKQKCLNALKKYNDSIYYVKKILKIEQNFVDNDIKDENLETILEHALVFLKDADKEWKILQTEIKLMLNVYKTYKKDEPEDWFLATLAFYDQFYEETVKYRTLICLNLSHSYNFFKILQNDENLIKYLDKNGKIYKKIALNFKLELKDENYINNVNRILLNIDKINEKIENKKILINLKKNNLI